MTQRHIALIRTMLFVLSALGSSATLALPAFPGAQGYGSDTPGGRGGAVLVVDSLADDGSEGTLRWALEQPYPRIIVFRVAGLIQLERLLPIGGRRGRDFPGDNPYSYVTVAGESAPGEGITLSGYPLALQNDVHDVIIRHLRIRAPVVDQRQGSIGDGIQFAGASNVIIDHVSVSWSADEGISLESSTLASNHDVTVQNSLIAEGLFNGGHPSGRPHSRCMIASDGSFNVSFHHNLMMSCNKRSPRAGGNSALGQADAPLVDIRHNLIYNFGKHGISFGRGARVNIVGNVIRPGPDSPPSGYAVFVTDREDEGTAGYLAGNCLSNYDPQQDRDVRDCPQEQFSLVDSRFDVTVIERGAPFDVPRIEPYGEDTEAYLLERAGALPRDGTDLTLVEQYLDFDGRLGADDLTQSEVEIVEPAAGLAPLDADADGMADAWELARGLDPSDPADAATSFGADGYTAIETYLHGLAGDLPAALGPGHSGSWFNPEQDGHGFLIEVLDATTATVFWLTFDADGDPLWLFNTGEIEGDTFKVSLLRPDGGRFPPDSGPGEVHFEPWGTLNIAFNGCDNGHAVWEPLPDSGIAAGQMPLKRMSALLGAGCATPGPRDVPRPPNDPAVWSGSWFDSAQPGQGFVVQAVSASQALVSWLTFDEQGEPLWLFNQGTIDEDGEITVDLLHASGPSFPPGSDSNAPEPTSWGQLVLDRVDCDTGQATWNPVLEGVQPGAMPLTRLTRIDGIACSEEAAPIHFAMQFQPEITQTGSVDAYAAHPAALPLPRYRMIYGSVFVWHGDRAGKQDQTRVMVEQAAAHGIRGVLFTPTAIYGEQLEARLAAGTVPPLDDLVQREWVSVEEPGFLDEILAQRDLFATLTEEGLVEELVLRPFQEAGSGIHDNTGLTPESYADLIEWLVNDIYAELPVTGVIVHWNMIDGLAQAMTELDRDIPIYSGLTASMPSNGGMAVFALSQEDPWLAGLDFATRSWEEAGLKTWIAELSVWDDGRVDPITGWTATGLTEPGVIEGFFEHYRNMRRTGLLGGITWLNKAGFTSRNMHLEDAKDGRWDGAHVDDQVRAWWLDEVVPAHGYRMQTATLGGN